jgi:hypothetical protein
LKTIICDIDGTLTRYLDGGHQRIIHQDHEALPGVVEHMRRWESKGARIILITGRRESVRQRTEDELRRIGIPFDVLLMGYADTGRILINDISPHVGNKAHAVNVPRDAGWNDIDWNTIGLDNIP